MGKPSDIYCSSTLTIKNYASILGMSVLIVLFSSLLLKIKILYVIIALIGLVVVFLIETLFIRDFSPIHLEYINRLNTCGDEKLKNTLSYIMCENGYVTFQDLQKVKSKVNGKGGESTIRMLDQVISEHLIHYYKK